MSENRGAAPKPSSPLDRVLDLAVYGPVGLAIAATKVLPRWVETGRRQVATQLTMARAVGRLAVDQGSRQAGDVVRRVAEEAEGILVGLGLVPDAGTDLDATDVAVVADPVTGSTLGGSPAGAPDLSASPSPGTAPTGLDAALLAIPGYDTLSASQVVQRLPGLTADELEAVRLHEVAGRSRKTVLLKVAQLRQGP